MKSLTATLRARSLAELCLSSANLRAFGAQDVIPSVNELVRGELFIVLPGARVCQPTTRTKAVTPYSALRYTHTDPDHRSHRRICFQALEKLVGRTNEVCATDLSFIRKLK